MLDCAISPVYVGAATQNAPPATPNRKRPIMSMAKFAANVTNAHPMVNGITSSNMVNFRPKICRTVPMTKHTLAAPSVTTEPTHEKSSLVITKSYSSLCSLTSTVCVGDDQPNAAPAAKAPPVAISY